MRASSIELTAKKSHYGVDGTGRDTYINFDNGGNFRGYGLTTIGKFQRGVFDTKSDYHKKSQGISGHPLHYIGDGTGRDAYIITNQGGLATQPGKKFNFLASLRQPIQRNTVKNNDIFTKMQNTWRSKGTSFQHNYQKNLDRKLSTPKKYQDVYISHRSTFKNSIGVR